MRAKSPIAIAKELFATPAPADRSESLPNVQAARARDAAARAALAAGHASYAVELPPDFATKIRTTELAGQRGRRR